jgi:MFS family permease
MKKAGIGEDDSMITKLRARGYTLNVVGISLASIIGGFVADGFGITVPFYLSAVPMICAIVFALLLPEPPRKSESEQGKFIKTLVSGVTYLARHPRLRKAAIEATLLNTVAYFSLWFFQPMLQELGVSVSYFGWFLTLLIVFETITNELYGRVEDKLSRTGLTKITARSVVIGMIFVTTLWYTWTTSGLWAAGMGAVVTLLVLVGGIGFSRTGLMEQYMNQYIEEHNRSTVLSAVSMMMSLGIVVANPIIGWLFTQSPVAAFGLLTAMAISALAMRLRWSEKN